ncbi:MAG: Molybdenum cofactor cytidylyltransferase [uncultured Thermomicrobiales bacterium]|uniref:Molybdenum cofactor cytidylyltransferase n=1 Tax=uncultured Thermomicrobiales bacterium TaxID=1645740 RepID=A0A6J4UTA6_9BACT|nr:MAG: Molybdenum cofactor cytidylyltransferase [uncultured Thermomicrobiales bacterium]
MASNPDRNGRIVGVILAAGMSTRLGRPKQLLEIGGKPLVAHVVDAALASALDDLIVVTGYQSAAIEAALGTREVRFCHNERFADGQSTSLVAALDIVPPDTDAIVVLLSDQPTVRTAVIDRLQAKRRDTASSIVMASYGGTSAHPVLFGSELFSELRQIQGDQGARDVIRRHRLEVVTVDGGADTPPPDVDTEEAYAALLAAWPG